MYTLYIYTDIYESLYVNVIFLTSCCLKDFFFSPHCQLWFVHYASKFTSGYLLCDNVHC